MSAAATPARDPSPASRLEAVEAKIVARIRDFEVTALLDLLTTLGYGADNIVFRGHLAVGPQPSLLHAITFPPRPHGAHARSEVIITVNLGLASCRSPLPSYFQRFLANLNTRDPVLELLETLDSSLLHERLTCDRPERVLPTWPSTQRNVLRIFGLDSPLGLRWLFLRVFPELGVHVQRIHDAQLLPYHGARLGASKLGACSFGDRTRVGVHDMEVTLICEDSTYQAGVPWIREGERRLRLTILPLLDELCMTLTVAFILLDRSNVARIGPTSYAGYDPMGRPGSVLTLPPTRVEVLRGALPPLEPDCESLERHLADHPDALTLEPENPESDIGRTGHSRVENPASTSLGSVVDLSLDYRPRGRRPHRYSARVSWGARAWYRDEPFIMTLSCGGVPKRSPTRRDHPRLWSRLLDAARKHLADRLAHEILATIETDTLDDALIERLIADGACEHLHALATSTVSREQWEDTAWRRFVTWNAAS